MATHQQGPFQGQVPPQPQNANQQRQVPNAQQKGTPGTQGMQTSQSNYDPQLTLWCLEKAKPKDSWTDVKPQQQHLALKELQDELDKFKQRDLTANRVLDDLDSQSCRKKINTLADEQTKELQKLNKTLRYILAGIIPKTKYIDSRKREKVVVRVQVILQTVPSGLVEPQAQKLGGAGAGNAAGAQPKPGNMQAQQNGNGAGHGPKTIHPQGPHQMGNGQHFEQHLPPPPGGHHNVGQGPPPPPPPPGAHQTGNPPPPPPPLNGGHVHAHGARQPQFHAMPGAFPDAYSMNHGRPHIEVLDPHRMHNQKHNQKHFRRVHSDESSSDWESETNSSRTGSFNAYSVEDGYSDVRQGRRKHSKRDSRARKPTHSKVRSRSRSVNRKSDPRSTRQRRNSDSSGLGRTGRRSPVSPRAKSPHYSSGDDVRRSHKKKYKYKNRSTEDLTQEYNRKAANRMGSPPMSRGSSSQGSWTDTSSSDGSSSFSRRFRESDGERERGHRRRRKHSTSHHHTKEFDSSRYDIPDPRYVDRDLRADDYPYNISREDDRHRGETVYGNRRPAHPRRATEQVNPFFQDTIPLRQGREQGYNNYGAGLREQDFAYVPPSQGYVRGNSPPNEELYTREDVKELLNRVNQDKQRRPLGRSQTERMGTTFLDTDPRVPLRSQYLGDQGFLGEDDLNPRYASRVPRFDTGYRR